MPSPHRHRILRSAGLALLALALFAAEAPAACGMADCPMMGAGAPAAAPASHCRPDRLAAADCCALAAPATVPTPVVVSSPAPGATPRLLSAALPAASPLLAGSAAIFRHPAPPGSSPPSGRERLALHRTLLI